MNLMELGWNEYFSALFEPYRLEGLSPSRVVAQHRDRCATSGEMGDLLAEVSGRFRHQTTDASGYPTVGDWVALEPFASDRGIIHAVLERRSAFIRKAAGQTTEAQVVAANVDTVFIVTGLDGNFNIRRIERYLTAAWDSGASPVIVLNKSDLRDDLAEAVAEVEAIALGTPVTAVSARDGLNVDSLRRHVGPGKTAALIGSSGAGKSTLINRLLGRDRLPAGPVRESDSRGRHTTSRRELIALPDGALLIDTPGMRELQLWADEESLASAFGDVEEIAARCRFADCRHESEPGCAVREALAKGALDPGRLGSFLKQRCELERLALKQDSRARRQLEKAYGRKMAALMKDLKLRKPNYR
ncbi:MAG: ribosome small subunit-dependent GTPase A [Candidatus Aminicenantales bacterium]